MPTIIFVDHAGNEHPVQAKAGLSVMEAANKNNVPGIDADCGGACSCATCQVYVDPVWFAKAGTVSTMEQAMLDFAERVKPNSRLACQIKITDDLDGLRVKIPESQR
jgi:2Fe-2S ferredoxin